MPTGIERRFCKIAFREHFRHRFIQGRVCARKSALVEMVVPIAALLVASAESLRSVSAFPADVLSSSDQAE
jgi:hypothetical protein